MADPTPPPDDDAIAAEWANMANTSNNDDLSTEWDNAASEGEFAGLQGGRVLDQDEIDSLLGFDGNDNETARSGIQAIINSSLVSYERLPMLDIVFDRLVRSLTTSLRNFTADNMEVSLDSITAVRFGDYLNSIPLPAMLAVFRAEEWDNYALMTIGSTLIYSIVDVLLGGRRGLPPMRIEGRPYTTIETNLIERMVEIILDDMSAAFEPLSPIRFKFDRTETNPRFATIARPTNAAVVVRLRIDMDERGGKIELLFPYATLEPVRELLLQRFMGEKFGRDTIWENHLASELWRTQVSLDALLGEENLTLGQVMDFHIGQTLLFNRTPEDMVEIRCGGIPLCNGKMGRSRNNVAILVNALSDKIRESQS